VTDVVTSNSQQSLEHRLPGSQEEHMHVGVTVPNFGPFFSPTFHASVAREAEEVGWDGFFVWDHVFFGFFPSVDPWVALTAIALNTTKIRPGEPLAGMVSFP
jgi:alkanesulfonate monooxygenase SsuD/methylene tetrahydromethanopterin reductase-like flavin-dependent oxidoreductase (luciferase family)